MSGHFNPPLPEKRVFGTRARILEAARGVVVILFVLWLVNSHNRTVFELVLNGH